MSGSDRVRKIGRVAFHQVERAAAYADRVSRRAGAAIFGRDALAREAAHWSGLSPRGAVTWQDHPVVRAHINLRVSGDPGVNWLEYFALRFGRPGFETGLNLGCGRGDLEAHAFAIGLCQRMRSIDISDQALARARERLSDWPVDFMTGDLNRVVLESESCDVAFAASSLHHLSALEHLLDQVRSGLRDGGFLVFDEYVGPNRLEWREDQLRMVNEILAALPRRLRQDLRRPFRYKTRVFRPPPDERNRNSPFEAARSEEILDLVEERFEVVLRRDYGGGLLHPLLDGIAGNFRADREDDASLLRRLAGLEQELERTGRIGSDFTVVVARKV